MEGINVNDKVSAIEISRLKSGIASCIYTLSKDFNQNFDGDIALYTRDRIVGYLHNNYSSWLWGDVLHVFRSITSGFYDIKKITVASLLSCFSKYNSLKYQNKKLGNEGTSYSMIAKMQFLVANKDKIPSILKMLDKHC
jgi:hypothetical protein